MSVTIYSQSEEPNGTLTGALTAMVLEHHHELIERICQGDTSAANEFYTAHQPWLVRIAASRVGEGDAEDVVQDVFAKLLKCEKLRPFLQQPEQAIRAWLSACTQNECISFLRRRANRRKQSLSEIDATIAAPIVSGEDDAFEEMRAVLAACLKKLTARQQQIIPLSLAGKSNEEISQVMTIAIDSVYKLRHGAMTALKKCAEGKLP